jgi:hypothetical protein
VVRVDVGLRGQLSVEALDERWGCWRHCAEFEVSILLQAQGDDEIKRLMAGGREAMDVVECADLNTFIILPC